MYGQGEDLEQLAEQLVMHAIRPLMGFVLSHRVTNLVSVRMDGTIIPMLACASLFPQNHPQACTRTCPRFYPHVL